MQIITSTDDRSTNLELFAQHGYRVASASLVADQDIPTARTLANQDYQRMMHTAPGEGVETSVVWRAKLETRFEATAGYDWVDSFCMPSYD